MDSMVTAQDAVAVQPKPTASVGSKAAHGAFWTVLFALLNKVVALISQVALARLLLPEEFGLVAMAFSITSVASLFSGINLKNILIQRQDRFDEDAGQVFWLSLAMNLTAAVLLGVFSPLAGVILKEPRVVPLILIVAVALPFMALPTVYSAALHRDLRFKTLAQIALAEGLFRNTATVVLAALDLKAYALVLPLLLSAVAIAVIHRLSAGRIEIRRPRLRLWPALLVPASWLLLFSLLSGLQNYGAAFVIGRTHSATVAGYYFWGFTVSSQAIFLLATNLLGVFFPVLSKLNSDSEQQMRMVQKAIAALTFAVVPVCVLQTLLARQGIELIFHERWLPAAPVIQWLSLGLLTQPVGILITSLLLARGQYRLLALVTGANALAVIAAATLNSQFGTQAGIARWIAGAMFLGNLVSAFVVCRELRQPCWKLLGHIAGPLAAAAPLALIGWLAADATERLGPATQVLVASAVVLTISGALAWHCVPALRELVAGRWRRFQRPTDA